MLCQFHSVLRQYCANAKKRKIAAIPAETFREYPYIHCLYVEAGTFQENSKHEKRLLKFLLMYMTNLAWQK